MAKKIWDKKNPKKKSTTMTPAQRSDAQQRAEEQGRDSPSLVDNINAMKGSEHRAKD